MTFERLRPVIWNGELVALAGPERFHIIAPRLREEQAPREDVEHVALLCLYHRQVLVGRLPHSSDPTIAERWVESLEKRRRAGVSD